MDIHRISTEILGNKMSDQIVIITDPTSKPTIDSPLIIRHDADTTLFSLAAPELRTYMHAALSPMLTASASKLGNMIIKPY